MPFTAETEPGKMKHTFTGLRVEFPNLVLHKIIRESVTPFRVELMKRTEAGGETQLTDTMRTYMLDNLETIRKAFQTHANTNVFRPDVTLDERKAARDSFINKVLNKANTAEVQTREPDFTNSDAVLHPADTAVHNITFDYTGESDKDFAQPTPDRVQNSVVREVVVGLDYLVVAMSRSHSADNPRTIIAQEAAGFITNIDLMYELVDSYDPGKVPFHPTATSLNEKETFFNADGVHDPAVTEGQAPGERSSTTRVGQPSS